MNEVTTKRSTNNDPPPPAHPALGALMVLLLLFMMAAFLLGGCASRDDTAAAAAAPPPVEQAVLLDGSGSAAGELSTSYHERSLESLKALAPQDVHLMVAVMAGDSDVSACPTADVTITADDASLTPETAWLRSARQALARVQPTVDCATTGVANGGSSVMPWTLLASLKPARGTLQATLVTDAMMNTREQHLTNRCLADTTCWQAMIAAMPATHQLDRVSISVVGAGHGANLDEAAARGLRRYWTAAVGRAGGSLNSWEVL